MEVYADDVISMPADQPPLRGKAAVRAMWEGLLRDFTIDSSVSVEEIEVSGDWAFERGAYRMKLTPNGGGAPIQEDGSWKYARVSFSSNGAGS